MGCFFFFGGGGSSNGIWIRIVSFWVAVDWKGQTSSQVQSGGVRSCGGEGALLEKVLGIILLCPELCMLARSGDPEQRTAGRSARLID